MFTEGWGKDVAFINGSLAQVFDEYNIDPKKIALEGFSDGSTYALSLGG
jgi:phospholipase/carboxylesterase